MTGPPRKPMMACHILQRPPSGEFRQDAPDGDGHQYFERTLDVETGKLREIIIGEGNDDAGTENSADILDTCPENGHGILEPGLRLIPEIDHCFPYAFA